MESTDIGRYVLVTGGLSWSEANDYCASQFGTTLATIQSDADASLILSNFSFIEDYAWIGLTDIDVEGDWVWASGYECDGECSDLDWWDYNAPDNYGGLEHCAVTNTLGDDRGIDRLMGDVNCASPTRAAFICDKGLCTCSQE